MAIAIEQSIATLDGAPDTSKTSTSWTPGSNELLLCLVAIRGTSTPSGHVTGVSGNGLTWAKILERDDTQNVISLVVYAAQGASPSAGGVTVTYGSFPLACSFQIIRLSGVDTSDAIGATATADTGATDTNAPAASVTTTRADSRVIGFGAGRNTSWTGGAGTDILLNQQAGAGGSISSSHSEYIDVASSGTNQTMDFSISSAQDWVAAAIEILEPGGTTYTQSAAGTLTTAGTLTRKAKKVTAGTLTTAGALVRKAKKTLAGTVTSAGTLTKKTFKAFTGTLTMAGALTAIRTVYLVLAGTLTSSGALTRKGEKSLDGTLTTAGALAKRTAKVVAGTLTSSGALTSQTLQIFYQAVGGTLTMAGALVRKGKKSLGGTLTTAGALVRKAKKTLAGTLTTAGALVAGLPVAAVAFTLHARRLTLSLSERLRTFTLRARGAFTLRDK